MVFVIATIASESPPGGATRGSSQQPASETALAAWPSGGALVVPDTKFPNGGTPYQLRDTPLPGAGATTELATSVLVVAPVAPPTPSNKFTDSNSTASGGMATTRVVPAGRAGAGAKLQGQHGGGKEPKKWNFVTRSALNLMSVRQEGNPMHVKMLKFLDGKPVTVLMTVFTIYALFGDDLRLALFPRSFDEVFYSLALIALVLFFVELMLNSIAKRDYLFSFYFWLDLLATLSLIPDIGWIWDPIVGTDDGNSQGTSAIQAGRASRAGTKAGRVVRIVRLVRLIRIVKLYKHVGGQHGESSVKNTNEPSQVGKHLSDLTIRRLIVLVLAMVIVLPLFNANGLDDTEDTYQIVGLSSLHRLAFAKEAGELHEQAYVNQLREYVGESGDLLHINLFHVPDATLDTWLQDIRFVDGSNNVTRSPSTGWDYGDLCDVDTILDLYRHNEYVEINMYGCFDHLGYATSAPALDCHSQAYFSNKGATVYEAAMNIAKTVFVLIVLTVGAIMFTRIAETLVIGPIERMVNMVKQLADNPLASVDSVERHDHVDDHKSRATYETVLLETTLAKIGGLLQIGFGEAGTEIIKQNMSHGGELNPLIAGRKMTGIFGFCDIRQFTDATECLQEEVMVFVNRIGDIVHFATHAYSGAANKNIGDAFLLVWRMPGHDRGDALMEASLRGSAVHGSRLNVSTSGEHIVNVGAPGAGAGADSQTAVRPFLGDTKSMDSSAQESKDLASLPPITATQLADNALYAFLKITVDIENSNQRGELRQYRNDERLRSRFPDGYSVRMGYGLHLGWAIEGAIGSKLKIDASYLSPNVNMASRLEAATKQYGSPILMSHHFANSLSPAAHRFCRRIDRVTVKGSKDPVDVYTFDVTDIPDYLGVRNKFARARAHFDSDPNVAYLQKSIERTFFAIFERGVELYLNGNWQDSVESLEQAMALKNNDGPCQTLLRVMRAHNCTAPADWHGVRALTEK